MRGGVISTRYLFIVTMFLNYSFFILNHATLSH
nr:MAG TPA: hypothetical protein [Caudoviricetes sp.]